MKTFAVLFLLLTSFVGANCVAQVAGQQQPPPYGDYQYHLPGLDDPPWNRVRIRSVPRLGPSPEPRVVKTGPLAPSVQDREKYAGFLSYPNTGLIRLLSREFNSSKASRTDRPKVNGGGAYYSFSFRSHEYGWGSDLELSTTLNFYGSTELPSGHNFSVGFAGLDYGMLTNIGDARLEDITVDDVRVGFMRDYEVPRSETAARCEALRFRHGANVDGQLYKRSMPIQANSTYLLRSIVYGRSDVLVGFRVGQPDDDGSVTIAWKLLKKFEPPKLERLLHVNSTDKCPTR
jgi:hypothetical protein